MARRWSMPMARRGVATCLVLASGARWLGWWMSLCLSRLLGCRYE